MQLSNLARGKINVSRKKKKNAKKERANKIFVALRNGFGRMHLDYNFHKKKKTKSYGRKNFASEYGIPLLCSVGEMNFCGQKIACIENHSM